MRPDEIFEAEGVVRARFVAAVEHEQHEKSARAFEIVWRPE